MVNIEYDVNVTQNVARNGQPKLIVNNAHVPRISAVNGRKY